MASVKDKADTATQTLIRKGRIVDHTQDGKDGFYGDLTSTSDDWMTINKFDSIKNTQLLKALMCMKLNTKEPPLLKAPIVDKRTDDSYGTQTESAPKCPEDDSRGLTADDEEELIDTCQETTVGADDVVKSGLGLLSSLGCNSSTQDLLSQEVMREKIRGRGKLIRERKEQQLMKQLYSVPKDLSSGPLKSTPKTSEYKDLDWDDVL